MTLRRGADKDTIQRFWYRQKGMRLKDTYHQSLLIERVFPKFPGSFCSYMQFPVNQAHIVLTKT
jgi:hypothetical protein